MAKVVDEDDADAEQQHDHDVERHRADDLEVLHEFDRVARPWPVEPDRQHRLVEGGDAVHAARPGREVLEHARHDLAEPQRHDGEVVATQAQRRGAEEHAECGRDDRADDEHRQEREGVAAERRRAIRVGVGAERKERGVAEIEQAGQADDDVQPDREQDERAGVREPIEPRIERLEGVQGRDACQDRQPDAPELQMVGELFQTSGLGSFRGSVCQTVRKALNIFTATSPALASRGCRSGGTRGPGRGSRR